jgi:cysteinyl-tRNA synthetase
MHSYSHSPNPIPTPTAPTHNPHPPTDPQEAATGQPFCHCWVHNGFVNVNNEKMSKSKGNFLTLRSALATDLELRAFRYLVVSSQYRTPLNFNAEALQGARKTVLRLDKLRAALQERAGVEAGAGAGGVEAGGETDRATEEVVGKALAGFEAGMADDLNTPRAVASLFTLVKGAEKALKAGEGALSAGAARRMLEALARMDEVVGVFYEPPPMDGVRKAAVSGGEPAAVALDSLDPEARDLVERRGTAKEAKDWALADQLREELRGRFGLLLKDVKGGGVQVLREAAAEVEGVGA